MVETIRPKNVLITLKQIKKNMLNKPSPLGAQQAMLDLVSMCDIYEPLHDDLREAMLFGGIESKDAALARLSDIINHYNYSENYPLVIRYAKEAKSIYQCNAQWYQYTFTALHGLHYDLVTKNSVNRIIRNLTERMTKNPNLN